MTSPAAFTDAATAAVLAHIESLRSELSFDQARALPEAAAQDIVVAGKEVQLTVYRQAELPFLSGQVLVAVQLARYGMGGITLFMIERGLVFSPDSAPRDATEQELADSRS